MTHAQTHEAHHLKRFPVGLNLPIGDPGIQAPPVTVTRNQLLTSQCRTSYCLKDFPFDVQRLETVLYVLPEVVYNWDIHIVGGKKEMLECFEQNFRNSDWEVVKGK